MEIRGSALVPASFLFSVISVGHFSSVVHGGGRYSRVASRALIYRGITGASEFPLDFRAILAFPLLGRARVKGKSFTRPDDGIIFRRGVAVNLKLPRERERERDKEREH